MSSTSARFPPTCRWMFTAMTAHRMSSLPMRSAISTIASSTDRPSRISDTTRWNSAAEGSLISLATWSRAWRKLCPARRELARIDRTSASCSAIFFCRWLRARTSHAYGIRLATTATIRTTMMFASSKAPRTPPATAQTAVNATNSPAFMGSPACSSFASRRLLKPPASANRSPAWVSPAGIHVGSLATSLPRPSIRLVRLRRFRPFAPIDKSSTATRNAATNAAPRMSVSQASVPSSFWIWVICGDLHQARRPRSGQSVARRIRVNGRDRTVVAGVHGLHHVQGLAATDLADHDPVRSHAQGVLGQVADRDLAPALDVRWPVLQSHHARLLEPEFRRVLDREDALVVGQERRQHVQRRRLPRARPPGHQHVQAPADTSVEQLHSLPGEGPERDQVIGPVRLGGELPDGQAGAVDREGRDDRVHARAVRQARVHVRRRLVDPATYPGHDLVDDPAELAVVVKLRTGPVDLAGALDVDGVPTVHHDFGDVGVAGERLERTQP